MDLSDDDNTKIELPKHIAKQDVVDFTITWDNHLQKVFYPDGSVGCKLGNRTLDAKAKLKNGRTIHIHKHLD